MLFTILIDAIRAQASPDLMEAIEAFSQTCDIVWTHLVSLAYECPAPRDVPTFLGYLKTLDPMEVQLRLLGYYVRYFRRAIRAFLPHFARDGYEHLPNAVGGG